MAQGKDLSAIQYIIGTGGALTRLPRRMDILRRVIANANSMKLLPTNATEILIDNYYIMASLGVLSKKHMEATKKFLKQTLNLKDLASY
jgi:hypothetical protein